MFKNSLQFYVDREKSYTSKTLADDFQKQATSNLLHKQRPFEGIPVKHDETTERIYFGQFENDGKDSDARISKLPRKKRRGSRTYVFINKYLKNGLDIQYDNISDFRTTYIDGELYYFFFNARDFKSKSFYPFKSRKKNSLMKSLI